MVFQGNLCCCLVSESIMDYCILTFHYFAGLTSCKEFYERKQEKKIGGQYIFYILPLFLGSTSIQWVRKFFLNTKETVASPSQSVKLC